MPLLLTADTNPGTASWLDFDVSLVTVGQVTVDAQTEVVAIPGVLATDLVFVTLLSDDTGGSLGKVTAAAGGVDQISITFQNAPTNDDGIASYFVVRP